MSFFDLFRKKRKKNISRDFHNENQPMFVQENNVQVFAETPVEPAEKEAVVMEYTLEQLMEIVEKENLSMLISCWENNGQGVIFDHRHHPCDTILRAIRFDIWDVYYQTSGKAREENIHGFDNWQKACRKALEYARAEKLQRVDSNAKINPRILRWSLDAEGTLTLSGKGSMPSPCLPQYRIIDEDQMAFELEFGDWMLNEGDVELLLTLPWDGAKVRKVVIEPGLTTVAPDAFNTFCYVFNNCCFNGTYELLKEIILPDTMKDLEGMSIQNCPVLQKVVIPASVRNIAELNFGTVFRNCPCVRIHTPAGSYAEAFAQRNGIITVNPSSTCKYTAPADSLPSNYRDPAAMPQIIPADSNSSCLRAEITKTPAQKGIVGPIYHLLFTGEDGTPYDLPVQEHSYAIKRYCSLYHASSSESLAFLIEETGKLLEKSYGVTDSKVRFERSVSGGPGTTVREFRLKEFSFKLWFDHGTKRIELAYEFKRDDNPFPDQLSGYLAECLTKLDSDFRKSALAPAKTVSKPQLKEKYLVKCQQFVYTANRGYRMPSEEEIYPLVAISDYLVSQGFTFCRASTGGGVSEILHSGDAPYHVVYRKLGHFRYNFVEDFFARQKEEQEASDGWISSLNYRYVDVYLKKEALLFRARVCGDTNVAWYGYTEQDKEIIERTDEAMRRILAKCTHVERQVQPQAEVMLSYWD